LRFLFLFVRRDFSSFFVRWPRAASIPPYFRGEVLVDLLALKELFTMENTEEHGGKELFTTGGTERHRGELSSCGTDEGASFRRSSSRFIGEVRLLNDYGQCGGLLISPGRGGHGEIVGSGWRTTAATAASSRTTATRVQ